MVSNSKLSVMALDESDRTGLRECSPQSSWNFSVPQEYCPPAGEAPGAPVKQLNRDNGPRPNLDGSEVDEFGLENVNRRLFADGFMSR